MAIKINAAQRLMADTAMHGEGGFNDWSKEKQEKYLKDHPKSKLKVGQRSKTNKYNDKLQKSADDENFKNTLSRKNRGLEY